MHLTGRLEAFVARVLLKKRTIIERTGPSYSAPGFTFTNTRAIIYSTPRASCITPVTYAFLELGYICHIPTIRGQVS